jgi:hypothetical protein
VSPESSSEEFNIRNAIINFSSTHHVAGGLPTKHKDQLAIKDVKWSHGEFHTIIATASANGRIIIYDLHRAGLEVARFNGHSRQVHRLAFNPHRPAWLLSGSQDSSIRMWDLRMASGERSVANCSSTSRYSGNSDAVRDIRWSPGDGVMFAAATDSGTIQCWDYRYMKAPQLRIAAHEKPCYAVDWHPDGRHLVSGGTDKQVKVWDFSSTAERRQKPTFQFRAPQAVVNVRWRPPCESQDGGDWQSTQLVTSYERDDPRIHLWDLRRPHIPFREFDRYETPAADLLWRSKDLLWTVGEAGSFTQTDIRYAPQVLNHRPMCAVAWSPTGDVVAITQKRARQRTLGITSADFIHIGGENDQNTSMLTSQSATDDGLDDSTLTSFRQKQTKGLIGRQSKSLGNTPPGPEDAPVVVPLEKALAIEKSLTPRQLGAVGQIAGVSSDADVFRYLAQQYAPLMEDPGPHPGQNRRDRIRALLDDLDHNADCAEEAGLLKLAQTWRIVRCAVVQELEVRAEENRRRDQERNDHHRKVMSPSKNALDRPRGFEETKSEKMKSHLFKGVMESEGSRRAVTEPESTSNVTTPLAHPLPDSPSGSRPSPTGQMASLTDDLVDLQPLPPSVMSSRYSSKTSNDIVRDGLATSDLGVLSSPRLHRQESESSENPPTFSRSLASDQPRDDQFDGPEGDLRSAPRAIAGRADWRRHTSQDFGKGVSEDDYEQTVEDKKALHRDYKVLPKKILNLETLASDTNRPTRPGGFFRHDSTESFPMFSASTDSSHRAKSIGTSFSSRTGGTTSFRRDSTEWDIEEDAVIAEEDISNSDSALGPNSFRLEREMSFGDSLPDGNNVHLQRPSSPARLLVEYSQGLDDSGNNPMGDDSGETSSEPHVAGVPADWDGLALPLTPQLTASKPWSAEVILREAIRHYHSNGPVDIQTAAHLLQKIHALFYTCESILPYDECGSIFKAYNEQLLRHSMYVEAAELRNFCVPKYPAVYEYSQVDTFINVFCYSCKKPYENPVRDNRRCHRCRTPQKPCPVCLNLEPPSEWTNPGLSLLRGEQDSENSPRSLFSDKTEAIPVSEMEQLDQTYTPTRPFGSSLWSWCQGCGHGGHVACMTRWLTDLEISEGGCPTPGCMHDCGPGPRRKENREASQTTAFGRRVNSNYAKRDSWVTGESRAVEKVRGMLTSAPSLAGGDLTKGSGSTAIGTTGSSGIGTTSPKKVRLVAPGEQDKVTSSAYRDRESTSDPFLGS